jgi:hypothetical protein
MKSRAVLDFDSIPEDERFIRTLNADWYCEPKDKHPWDEFHRQKKAMSDLEHLAPRIIAWAVPSGGKRSQWQAMRARGEGMRPGVPDLTLIWPGGCAFVEFKSGTGAPDMNQKEMLNRLHRAGHHCGVFRTSGALLEKLKEWGAPLL